MDPYSGDVYRLRPELLDEMLGDARDQYEAAVGEMVDMDAFRRKVAALGAAATADEAAAIRAEKLVLIDEQAARRLGLGAREQERRRRRRKAEKRARRRNR